MAQCEAVKSPVRKDGDEEDEFGPQPITKLQVIYFFLLMQQRNILKFHTQFFFALK